MPGPAPQPEVPFSTCMRGLTSLHWHLNFLIVRGISRKAPPISSSSPSFRLSRKWRFMDVQVLHAERAGVEPRHTSYMNKQVTRTSSGVHVRPGGMERVAALQDSRTAE